MVSGEQKNFFLTYNSNMKRVEKLTSHLTSASKKTDLCPITLLPDKSIGIITLSKPPANLVAKDLTDCLDSSFDKLTNNDSVKVIIIIGSNTPFFSAGVDVSNVFKKSINNKISHEDNGDLQTRRALENRKFLDKFCDFFF